MSDIDRTAVIMSIRKPYADALLDGTKPWEFRRQPLPHDVETVLVNRSGCPAVERGIVGTFTVAGSTQVTPRSLLPSRPEYGITCADLADYAGGWDAPVWAIEVSETWCCRPVPLSALGIDRAPQSWRYAPSGWAKSLLAVAVTR